MSQEGMLGEVKVFAGNFAPKGWAFCAGQLLLIAQNSALFSVLGTTYGGDGRTTFALPDLRGRSPIGVGHGPGLNSYVGGQQLGTEQVTLNANQIPAHTHDAITMVNASNNDSVTREPQSGVWAAGAPYDIQANTTMADNAVQVTVKSTGGSQAHENRPPSLAMHWIICIYGTFPIRD